MVAEYLLIPKLNPLYLPFLKKKLKIKKYNKMHTFSVHSSINSKKHTHLCNHHLNQDMGHF